MKWYFKVLKNYATFSGRARRKEYWMFTLFSILISIALMYASAPAGIPLLDTYYSFAVLLPSIAVGVRRMHDVNKSGWNALIPIYNIILFCEEGTKGDNDYGPDPKIEVDTNPDILHS